MESEKINFTELKSILNLQKIVLDNYELDI